MLYNSCSYSYCPFHIDACFQLDTSYKIWLSSLSVRMLSECLCVWGLDLISVCVCVCSPKLHGRIVAALQISYTKYNINTCIKMQHIIIVIHIHSMTLEHEYTNYLYGMYIISKPQHHQSY